MTTYNQLEKEFEKKVDELKKNCKHKRLSKWMQECWALGHYSVFQVRICKKCRTIVKRRTTCMKCENITENYVNGDGRKRPCGEYLCKQCDEIKKEKSK